MSFDPTIQVKVETDDASLRAASKKVVAQYEAAAKDAEKALKEATKALANASTDKEKQTAERDIRRSMGKMNSSLSKSRQLTKTLGLETEKVAKKTKKASDEARAFSDGFVQTLPVVGKLLTPISRMAVGMGLVKNAFKTFFDLTIGNITMLGDEAARLRDISMSARWFKVPIDQGKRLQSILSDVKTTMEATQLSTELSNLGLDSKEIENFGHTINVLAAFTGESKATIEKSLKSAQITDRQLAVLKKTRLGLQSALAQAQIDGGGRSLDMQDRVRTLINFLGVTQQTEKALGNLGKANPMRELTQDVKTAWEAFKKELLPVVLQLTKALIGAGNAAIQFVKFIKPAFDWAKGWAKWTSEALAYGGALTKLERERLANHKKQVEAEKKRIKLLKDVAKADQGNIDIAKRLHREYADDQIKIEKQVAEQRNKIRKASLEKMRAQYRLEAQQETLARMKQARTLIRNFDRSALSALSRSGVRGVGQIIGGLSQAIELARTFRAGLGAAWEQNTKAALIYNATLDTGIGGLNKLIASEKQRTNQIRSQISLDKDKQQTLAIENQILNQQKTLVQARKLLTKSIKVLEESRVAVARRMAKHLIKLRDVMIRQTKEQLELLEIKKKIQKIDSEHRDAVKKIDFEQKRIRLADDLRRRLEQNRRLEGRIVRDRGERAQVQANLLQKDVDRLKADLKKDRNRFVETGIDGKILLERQMRNTKLLKIQEKILQTYKDQVVIKQKLAALADKELKNNRLKQGVNREMKRVKAERELLNAKRAFSPLPGVGPGQAAAQDLAEQIRLSQINIQMLKDRIALTTDPGVLDARSKELQHQKEMLAIQNKRLEVLQRNAEIEKFQASLGGQVVLQMAQKTSDAIGQLFTDLVAEPEQALANLGKNILAAFGDMAFQLAGFAFAQALLMAFTPGGQAAAVGLGAAGVALLAIGGALKGFGAIAGGAQKKVPKSSSKKTKQPGLPAANNREPGQTTINNYYNDVPWSKNNPQQSYRDMTAWSQRMERSTGRSLQPRIGGR